MHDLRLALRNLLRRPGFTAVAVATLALGIGANTAVFTVFHAVLLAPLPYDRPAEVVMLNEHMPKIGTLSVTRYNYDDWRKRAKSFSGMAAFRPTNLTVSGVGEPERVPAKMLTADLLPMLGVRIEHGRAFSAADDLPGAEGVALVSSGFAERKFPGGEAVGRTIQLDQQPHTIVGIMPPRFELFQPADVYVPFGPWAATLPEDRGWHPGIFPMARLKDGVSLEDARVEMDAIAQQLEAEFPESNRDVRALVIARAGAAGPEHPAGADDAARGGGAGAADRLRERRQPAPRAGGRPAEGDRRPRRPRRQPHPHRPATARRERGAGVHRRPGRPAGGVVGRLVSDRGRGDWPAARAQHRASTGRWCFFTFGAVGGDRARLRAGAGAAGGPLRHPALPERGRPQRPRQRAPPPRALDARGRRSGAWRWCCWSAPACLLRSFSTLTRVSPAFNPENLLVVNLPLSPQTYGDPVVRDTPFERIVERVRALPGVSDAAITTTLPMAGRRDDDPLQSRRATRRRGQTTTSWPGCVP